MFVGPVFGREVAITPRRPKFYIYRALYPTALLLLVCTAWLILAGTQVITNVGDMARFGAVIFQLLALVQLPLVIFFSAMSTASSIALEKDRRTLVLLLMTRMTNHELVLGKLLASLLNLLVMLAAGLPMFALIMLFGGVSLAQLMRVFLVAVVSGLACGSLGATLAFWREKTFQTLALTAICVMFWLGICEVIASGLLGTDLFGIPCQVIATGLSPVRATFLASQAMLTVEPALRAVAHAVNLFVLMALVVTCVLNAISITFVRVWNPSRELVRGTGPRVRPVRQAPLSGGRGTASDLAEDARAGHVDHKLRGAARQPSRDVWDNPVLWREVCTWAYGKKVVFIRFAYFVLFAFVAIALFRSSAWEPLPPGSMRDSIVPAAAKPLVPFLIVSLVIVNTLAVTSITSERDGRSLDLLLVTDLSPSEFMFGKLGGIFWVAREMVILPLLLCAWLWWSRVIATDEWVYLTVGMLLMNVFVATLGVHCGMIHANTRAAISVSSGTVFFLCLGVLICILMMISFSGSFQVQLAPFLAFILGGGVGLYVCLGARNPSSAIALASLIVPFATFYAVVSFLLQRSGFTFLVTVGAYGFSTAAMLVPALHEFDFAMGRTTVDDE